MGGMVEEDSGLMGQYMARCSEGMWRLWHGCGAGCLGQGIGGELDWCAKRCEYRGASRGGPGPRDGGVFDDSLTGVWSVNVVGGWSG